MICEHCNILHSENYASGRFCSEKCSRAFSTFEKRELINEKVSLTLTKHSYVCFCGESASRKSGGTDKYCVLHKHKIKDLLFEELKTARSRKKFLISKNGYKCEICKRNRMDGTKNSNSTRSY